jgi:hypothetical protein
MMLHRTFLAAVIGVVTPIIATAQTIRGVVVDRGDVPVPGVVIQLLDEASTVVSRSLSNERGEFQVAATREGRYRLHTLRIGFRPVLSDLIPLAAGQVVTQRLVLTGVQISLDTVRVASAGVCRRLVGDTAVATFSVWEQARTALAATEASTSAGTISATTVTYERTLDPSGKRVVQQHTAVHTALVAQPWHSPPPDSLRRVGYVIVGRDSATFRAPGLDMLLSSAFIEDHCFHLVTSRDSSRIGIAFEPTSARSRVSEIRGTLWLDRVSSELRSLDFRFVNVVAKVNAGNAGGEMEFVRMANGVWAISRWSLRLSTLERRMVRPGLGGSRGPDGVIASLYVKGGELALALLGADTLWSRAPLVLRGTVVDSASDAAIPNARLTLEETGLSARTDNAGRFAISGVLPGDYLLAVQTPSLDSVSAVHEFVLAFTDSQLPLHVRVPNAPQFAAALCGTGRARAPEDELRGVVFGTIGIAGDSVPPANARVIAEWTDSAGQPLRGVATQTDARGQFRLCGVPVSTAVVLRAEVDAASAKPTDVRMMPQARFARVDLLLDRVAAREQATITAPAEWMKEFEENRKAGRGHFLTRADLQTFETRSTAAALSQLPGVQVVRGNNFHAWLATGRGVQSLLGWTTPRLETADSLAGAKAGPCYARVYLDHLEIYSGRDGERLFDLATISPDRIEAIEYYARPAESPPKYGKLNVPCGVLVIHSRVSP